MRQVIIMESQIKTYTYPNGDIQRVQVVRPDSWAELNFLEFPGSDRCDPRKFRLPYPRNDR